MNKIINALDDLEFHGLATEKPKFESFKRRIVREAVELQHDIHDTILELKRHHSRTLKHNLLVAYDTSYIAKKMGLVGRELEALELAAFFHDLGKLDIHAVILDMSAEEQIAAWKKARPTEPVPDMNTIRNRITVEQFIEAKADKCPSGKRRLFIEDMKRWLKKQDLFDFYCIPYYAYFKHHQHATGRILGEVLLKSELGKNWSEVEAKQIIEFATAHHPEYFISGKRAKLPKWGRIIEVADKFNAIIQSEGAHKYISKTSKIRALEIIFSQIKDETGTLQREKKKMVNILAEKYLTNGITQEPIPEAESLQRNLRDAIDYVEAPDKSNLARARRTVDKYRTVLNSVIADITTTLAMIGKVHIRNFIASSLENKLITWKETFERTLDLATPELAIKEAKSAVA